MSDSNTATSLPAPDANSASAPALTVVTEPAPPPSTPLLRNRRVEAELSRSLAVCTAAQKPEYAPALTARGIAAAFVSALVTDIELAQQFGQAAVESTAASHDAVQTEGAGAVKLVDSLHTIQAAARTKHLPEHPELLADYYVGERLALSRPLLEAQSQGILAKAETERPGGLDTNFIVRVQEERAAYMAAGTQQTGEVSEGKQQRQQRDALVKSIIARRKKIQYTADVIWPPKLPASVQARSDFKLPVNRPYSY